MSEYVIISLLFVGYGNSDVFRTYVEGVLVKYLKKEQIVIMDNISFHKTESVEKEAV